MRYKLIKDFDGIKKIDTENDHVSFIPAGSPGWNEYQEWLESNAVEPIETPEEEALRIAFETKLQEIIDAQNDSGIKNVTVNQAYTYIDNQFTNASNTAETVLAIQTIFKKMVPFILR